MKKNKVEFVYTRKQASLGMLSTNHMSYTNPWIIMAWSFFFPGFGHFLLGQFIQGWLLFLWEVIVNVRADFNYAIMLAFTGKFQESIQVLTTEGKFWILLYGSVFCYTLFESYHLSLDGNKMYALAYRENVPIEIFKINAVQINYFNKKNPWIAAIWSLLMPGLGELYNRRITSYVFVLGWWIIIVYFSNFLPATMYTFTGQFKQATSILNVEWTLFLPSIYGYSFFNSYTYAAEQNKLFDKQQANFLKNVYQSGTFPFRLNKGGNLMRIVSVFDHSLFLEKALMDIQEQGISKEQLFAVPVDKSKDKSSISVDTMHYSDGKSFIDIPSLLAAFFCALGTIYGFVLYWGPVIWGLIGFAGGFILGCIIKILGVILHSKKKTKHSKTEVVLMIDCPKDQSNQIVQILWENHAFGVSKEEENDP